MSTNEKIIINCYSCPYIGIHKTGSLEGFPSFGSKEDIYDDSFIYCMLTIKIDKEIFKYRQDLNLSTNEFIKQKDKEWGGVLCKWYPSLTPTRSKIHKNCPLEDYDGFYSWFSDLTKKIYEPENIVIKRYLEKKMSVIDKEYVEHIDKKNIEYLGTEKVECTQCGVKILPSTYDENFGKCAHCRKGTSYKTNQDTDCFIVTATMGNDSIVLSDYRKFRDKFLINNFIGNMFIWVYYKIGPKIASLIKENNTYKHISKYLFIIPIHKLLLKRLFRI